MSSKPEICLGKLTLATIARILASKISEDNYSEDCKVEDIFLNPGVSRYFL
jgi:hypothetical protein